MTNGSFGTCIKHVAVLSGLLVALGGPVLGAPATAWAQSSPAAESAESPESEAGGVQGIVFGSDGLPAAGVTVRLDDASVETSADGAFRFEDIDGAVTLYVADTAGNVAQRAFTIPDDTLVEVLVTLGDPATFDLEGATVADEVAEQTEAVDEAEPGRVTGVMTSEEDDSPVVGARVFVRGQDVEALSDADGRFTLELPPGTHDLSVIHPDFSSQDISDVTIASDETTEVSAQLAPAAVALADFTVTAPRIEGGTAELLDERKDASSVNEVIGAEQMSKSGASNAADALSRVTGITIVGGKFVYVRGLGERYSSTLMNGATLPSPEPDKRVVPLDIFPTDMLESVVIQKTYTPNMPGAFGGGVVMLRSRRLPSENGAEVSVSVGYNSQTTFREGLSYPGGSLDFLGFDDGTRALPASVDEASSQSVIGPRSPITGRGFAPEELEELGEAFDSNFAANETGPLGPDIGVSGSLSRRYDLFGQRSGVRFGFVYDHGWDTQREERNFYRANANGIEETSSYDFLTTSREVTLGGILTTGVEFDEDEQILLTSIFNRLTDDTARIYEGRNEDVDAPIRVTRLRWQERLLSFNQLAGEHTLDSLGELELDWHYVLAVAGRDEPNRRESRYDLEDGVYRISLLAEGNQRFYSDLGELTHDVGVDLALPIGIWNQLEMVAKFGLAASVKDREVTSRRYAYGAQLQNVENTGTFRALPPDELFTDENIGPDAAWQLEEVTRSTDSYTAAQTIGATYLMAEMPLTKTVETSFGARFEYSDQALETFQPFVANPTVETSDLQTFDVLPAANISWAFIEDMQLRGAFAQTVSRPDFRELSPFLFKDVAGGVAIQGNPELQRALITHADARWEWYPDRGETVSVGAFYKFFDQPIESIRQAGAQQLVTFANVPSATNIGAELEFRKGLGFVWGALDDVSLASNIALISSSVELPEDSANTTKERPLQGQSPYVLNVSLAYDNVDLGTSLTVLFNVVGPRITEVGIQGVPDTTEEAVPRLDIVYKQQLGAGFDLGLKAKNLLNPDRVFTQAGEIATRTREGVSVSASVGYEF